MPPTQPDPEETSPAPLDSASTTASASAAGTAADPAPLLFNLESYRKHGKVIAVMMASYQLRHLHRLYQAFDGDLILPIILGEIAHYNVMRFFSSEGYVAGVQSISAELEPVLRPCNAFSISEATGIPRETVRRKVEKLIAMDWVRRNSRGHLFVTHKPYAHFGPEFNVQSLQELLELSDRLRALLNSA